MTDYARFQVFDDEIWGMRLTCKACATRDNYFQGVEIPSDREPYSEWGDMYVLGSLVHWADKHWAERHEEEDE